eukprot:3776491-Prymnesium_polylepis.1
MCADAHDELLHRLHASCLVCASSSGVQGSRCAVGWWPLMLQKSSQRTIGEVKRSRASRSASVARTEASSGGAHRPGRTRASPERSGGRSPEARAARGRVAGAAGPSRYQYIVVTSLIVRK